MTDIEVSPAKTEKTYIPENASDDEKMAVGVKLLVERTPPDSATRATPPPLKRKKKADSAENIMKRLLQQASEASQGSPSPEVIKMTPLAPSALCDLDDSAFDPAGDSTETLVEGFSTTVGHLSTELSTGPDGGFNNSTGSSSGDITNIINAGGETPGNIIIREHQTVGVESLSSTVDSFF